MDALPQSKAQMAPKEKVGVKVSIRTTAINIRERICASYSGGPFDVNTRREDAQSKHSDRAGTGSLSANSKVVQAVSYCSLCRAFRRRRRSFIITKKTGTRMRT